MGYRSASPGIRCVSRKAGSEPGAVNSAAYVFSGTRQEESTVWLGEMGGEGGDPIRIGNHPQEAVAPRERHRFSADTRKGYLERVKKLKTCGILQSLHSLNIWALVHWGHEH